MGDWNHLPKRPPGLQVERWKRMCAHAHHILELERLQEEDPQSPSIAKLHETITAGRDVTSWKQYPLARHAVRELAQSRQSRKQWAYENPAEFLEHLHKAMINRTWRIDRRDGEAWIRIANGIILGHQRTQFAAGQGGFHAGGLTRLASSQSLFENWADQQELAKADFLYVYDCGSHPVAKVEAEVSDFLRRAGRRRLDFLFLSHFDADHVSGLPRLIGAGGLEVDTIVMPYVDDLERVIAFARAASRPEPVQAFLEELVVDTVGTLKNLGAGRILLMDNGEGPPPDAPFVDPFGGGTEDLPWKLSPLDGGGLEVRDGGRDSFYVRDGAIDIAGATDDGLELAWRFLPYVQHAEADTKELFVDIAESLLGWEEGSFAWRIRDAGERRKLVTQQAGLLGDAYRSAFGNKNATSMSLYSGPANPSRVGATVIRPPLGRYPLAKIGWLGTGDAPLRAACRIAELEAHYGELLDAVSTFMLPHHGSIHNSHPKRLISDADIYVASAEPTRDDWEHPAQRLRKAVEGAGKRFHHVSSARGSRLEEVMILFCPPSELA